jgi:hypothetical protein
VTVVRSPRRDLLDLASLMARYSREKSRIFDAKLCSVSEDCQLIPSARWACRHGVYGLNRQY